MSFMLSVIPAKAGAEDDRRSIHEQARERLRPAVFMDPGSSPG
jgi:hypothetical protein